MKFPPKFDITASFLLASVPFVKLPERAKKSDLCFSGSAATEDLNGETTDCGESMGTPRI